MGNESQNINDVAEQIYAIIKGYRNDDGIYLQSCDILEWAMQFQNDAYFVLSELHHLLKQIYLSKEDAIKCLKHILNQLYKDYKFNSVEEFLESTCFLNLQPEGKSQDVYLKMLDDIVYIKTEHHISEYDKYPKKLYVYFDDVLASGGTVRRDLVKWLETENHAEYLEKKEIQLELSFICVHTLGLKFMLYAIQKKFGNLHIKYRSCYEIQNHLKFNNQALNIAIPVKNQSKEAELYLAQLEAVKYEEYAYRDPTKPEKEIFFTNSINRVKFENLILEKGLYIIKQIKGETKPNVRPLGLTSPNYKTFGLGTHFFTWRNIPNNCPLVYWWSVSGHNWKPLFPPKRNDNL